MVIPILAILAVAYQDSGAMTLNQAIEIAVQNSYAMKRTGYSVAKSRQQINEGYARLRPSLSATGTYIRYDQKTTADLGGGQSIVTQPIDSTTAAIAVNQSVDISGLQRLGVRAAKALEASGKEGLAAERNLVIQSVRLAYFDVLRAQSAIPIAEEALGNAKERRRLAEARVKAEYGTKVEVLRADTQIAQNEQQLIQAKSLVEIAKAAFNNTLGRDVNAPVNLAAPGDLAPIPGEVQELQRQALATRPEVRQWEWQVRLQEINVALERKGNWPTLSLRVQSDLNFNPTLFNSRRERLTGFATLSFPFFDFGITKARVAGARVDEASARVSLEELKQGIQLEVKQAFLQLRDAEERQKSADTAVEEAVEALRLAQIRYKNEVAIQLEVSDAELALTQARINAVNARYDYFQAHSRLRKAIGVEEKP